MFVFSILIPFLNLVKDGCIENSNMVQSINPKTTHGKALHRLFCWDFIRPNCLGATAAATHLTNYAFDFIKQYTNRPWAAFLSFIDSHEDTVRLILIYDVL